MTPNQIRNRIKSHRRVRAGDLVPHELNFHLRRDLEPDTPRLQCLVPRCVE